MEGISFINQKVMKKLKLKAINQVYYNVLIYGTQTCCILIGIWVKFTWGPGLIVCKRSKIWQSECMLSDHRPVSYSCAKVICNVSVLLQQKGYATLSRLARTLRVRKRRTEEEMQRVANRSVKLSLKLSIKSSYFKIYLGLHKVL